MTNKTITNYFAKKWRGYMLNLLLFIVLVVAIRTWQQRDMISGAAPTLGGLTLAGQAYNLPIHPEKPILLHFWATWCSICSVEQDAINAIAHDHPNMISVAMQSGSKQQIAKHMHAQGLSFPVINDSDGKIARQCGVHGVPASFIIAPDGTIQFIEVGYTSGIGLRLRLWLAGFV
ncbi:MAG: protein disulfide oxidoreductase [Gallionellaceae bacterium]